MNGTRYISPCTQPVSNFALNTPFPASLSPCTDYFPIQLTIHESIRTLAIRLAQPGAAPRAQFLFDVAMQRAKLRWGRTAKLASGATLALALREASRGDLTNDIAVSQVGSLPS